MSDVDKAREYLEHAEDYIDHMTNGEPSTVIALAALGTGYATLAALEPAEVDEAVQPDGARFSETLSSFSDDALAEMIRAAHREQIRRSHISPIRDNPRGGAAQWNG